MKSPAHDTGMDEPLILASASPRRRALLRQLGIPFRVVRSSVSEAAAAGESPEARVLRLSRLKARDVAARRPGRWVIGADTIVLVAGMILGKPETVEEAHAMLGALQGRAHEVLTGICVLRLPHGPSAQRVVRTTVHMRDISPQETAWYVGTGEPFDKAGAYAIQGLGSVFVTRIEGSYTNVVGLPVPELIQILRELGAWDLSAGG
jgi:septum formation protein